MPTYIVSATQNLLSPEADFQEGCSPVARVGNCCPPRDLPRRPALLRAPSPRKWFGELAALWLLNRDADEEAAFLDPFRGREVLWAVR